MARCLTQMAVRCRFDPVVFVGTATAMPSARGTLNEVGGLFAHLQCFAGADSNDAFLELTFLPADITCPR